MWHIEDSNASLTLHEFSATVGLKPFGHGLQQIRHLGQPLDGCELLCWNVPTIDSAAMQLTDSYIRGADLVASYRAESPAALTTQVYWRAVQRPEESISTGVELIISIQTDLLDSHPIARVHSRLPIAEILTFEPSTNQFQPLELNAPQPAISDSGVTLFRLPGGRSSYLEMIHPSDHLRTAIHHPGADRPAIQTEHSLFDHHLEKGVIRRGRLRGIVLPRGDDQQHARACYQQFLQAEIPLTT